MIGGHQVYVFDELARRIAVKRQERMESLAAGTCSDFADYRHAVGFFDGMSEALAIADDIRKEQDRA